MLRLRPLVILTGTVHVEGGETSRSRKTGGQGRHLTVVENREVDPERSAANVKVVAFHKRLKRLAILRTPFGVLIDPVHLPDLKELLIELTRTALAFSRTSSKCELTNCLLWESLEGNRKAAVETWITRRLKNKNPVVIAVVSQLKNPIVAVAG